MTLNSDAGEYLIRVGDKKTIVYKSEQHPSLLYILESHEILVEFQCREGFCGSCRMKLIKGGVIYTQSPLAFIQKDEILPCCCLPAGDIDIEFY